MPFDNWLNRTFLVWITCIFLMVAVSLFSRAPAPASIQDIIWTRERARLPESERERNRGYRNLFLWWAIFIGLMAALYAYLTWFQFWGPGRGAG
jgi:SSS family solute:Na+ symporter